MTEIVGIDAGGNQVKVFGERGTDIFLSELGEYRDLKLTNRILPDDMVYEYRGDRGFAGTLAQRESEFSGSMMGSNKAHHDMVIRVLIALHRYAVKEYGHYNIIVGQPITNHTEAYKSLMKGMLIENHEFTLNGVTKYINIERVEVSAEGASSYWSSPRNGKIRIIDAGSGTVNIATIDNGMYIDKESDTLEFGLNTNISNDLEAFSRRVAISCLKKWGRNDKVLLVGGHAIELLTYMRYHFPNSEVLQPNVLVKGTSTVLHPIYANAVAFYYVAKKVYAIGV